MYTVTIETRHGGIFKAKGSLAKCRAIFNEEIAWESTKRITIHGPDHKIIVSEPGDYAWVDEAR